MQMRTEFAVVLLACMAGCSHRHDLFAIVEPNGLDARERRTIELAAQFISTNQNWPGGEFERPKHLTNGGWSVLVWRHPRRGDENKLILMDTSGRFTASHDVR